MPHISPKEAALALGVSESSVRRWVDSGVLPCERTEGGHRRIETADLISYARSQGLSWRRGAPPRSARRPQEADAEFDQLIASLAGANFAGTESLVLASYASGNGLGHIFDLLIAPAMGAIGERWTGGSSGILAEHAATSILADIIRRLRDLQPGADGPPAIGGAIEGDPYSLPTQMADTVLHGLGYSSFDLGPNTPIATIEEAASMTGAELVWISVNSVSDPVTVRRQLIGALRKHASSKRRHILGGRALTDLELPAMKHVHQVTNMRELEALAAR